MRWFRLYDEVLNDPKVQRLAGDTFKFWINVLCIASKHGGVLPSIEDMAFELRVSISVCTSEISVLKQAGLIDGDKRLRPHGWDKRQYKSDTSTERVKRFRERSSNVAVTVDETGPDTDTETDTDTEKKERKNKQKERKSRSASSAEFDLFWNSYPKKVGRGAAEKAWQKAIAVSSVEEIVRVVQVYPWGEDKQFIPHPATWLNQKRWQDDFTTTKTVVSKPSMDNPAALRKYWATVARERPLTETERAEANEAHHRQMEIENGLELRRSRERLGQGGDGPDDRHP